MISPSVKNRMWALIIHPDSEGIDLQRWQRLDGWDWRGWENCWLVHTFLHLDAHAHTCLHTRGSGTKHAGTATCELHGNDCKQTRCLP